jgi:hypothetical protein
VGIARTLSARPQYRKHVQGGRKRQRSCRRRATPSVTRRGSRSQAEHAGRGADVLLEQHVPCRRGRRRNDADCGGHHRAHNGWMGSALSCRAAMAPADGPYRGPIGHGTSRWNASPSSTPSLARGWATSGSTRSHMSLAACTGRVRTFIHLPSRPDASVAGGAAAARGPHSCPKAASTGLSHAAARLLVVLPGPPLRPRGLSTDPGERPTRGNCSSGGSGAQPPPIVHAGPGRITRGWCPYRTACQATICLLFMLARGGGGLPGRASGGRWPRPPSIHFGAGPPGPPRPDQSKGRGRWGCAVWRLRG